MQQPLLSKVGSTPEKAGIPKIVPAKQVIGADGGGSAVRYGIIHLASCLTFFLFRT
jgi:hypothetical protein